MGYGIQLGGFVEGVGKGQDIGIKRRAEKRQKEQDKTHQKNVETQQGLQGLEVLNSLSQHEAAADAALDGLLAKRSPLVQEEMQSSAMLSLAEMSKDPGAIARATARHEKAFGALSELDAFLSGKAAERESFGKQSAMTRDFLTKNGLLNGLLEARGAYEQLNAPSESQQQPAPFTMPGMQQGGDASAGEVLGAAIGKAAGGIGQAMGGEEPAGAGEQADVGAPGVDVGDDTVSRGIMGEEQAAAQQNPSTPTDQVLSMWDQQATQVGLPKIGSPEARIENGTIVYTTNDSDIAKNWEQRIGKLGEFVGGTPPMVVKDRGAILKDAVKDLATWSDREGRQQHRISSFERMKATPEKIQDIKAMALMARERGNIDDAETWDRIANASEGDRVKIIDEAIKAAEPDLKMFKNFRERAQKLAEEHYDIIGAGALLPPDKVAPAKRAAAPGADRNAFFTQWLADHGMTKFDAASARAAQAEWEKMSGGR